VKIDRFAFTANNITYAVVGDQFGYWQFFPPTGDEVKDWGILPVWGFADVVTLTLRMYQLVSNYLVISHRQRILK
jgi:hypothetical protein